MPQFVISDDTYIKSPENAEMKASEQYIEYAVAQFKEHGISEQVTRALIQAESEGYPDAYNPEAHRHWRTREVLCYGSYGLFQIGCVNYIHNPEALYDPYLNVDVAVQVLQSQGITAWGAFTDQRYKQFLN